VASSGERGGGRLPDRDTLVIAFGDVIVPSLKGLAKAIYSHGRFVKVDDTEALFALENAATCQRAERYRADVEAALSAHFGCPVPLRLVDEGSLEGVGTSGPAEAAGRTGHPVSAATTSGAADDDEAATIDLDELEDAVDVAASGIEKLTEAFPGAVLVEDGEGS
jgi:DNA polymerase-3 subunit gamma/tau